MRLRKRLPRLFTFGYCLLTFSIANGQDVESAKRHIELEQHDRARTGLQKALRGLPESQLQQYGYQPPWNRHDYVLEICQEQIVDVNDPSVESLFSLSMTKLINGKVEAAELIAGDLRESSDRQKAAAFTELLRQRRKEAENREWPNPAMLEWILSDYALLAGEYSEALEHYRSFASRNKQYYENMHIAASATWCQAKLNPNADPEPNGERRRTLLTAATGLANQKKTEDAIMMLRRGIRAHDGNSGKYPTPFFISDYPSCDKLFSMNTPSAAAARDEYNTLIRLYKVAAAMIAFQKSTGSFPQPIDDGKSWREQIAPSFELPDTAHVVSEMFAVTAESTKTPFVVVTGPDTAFPRDVATAPGRWFYDGTANTMMIVAGPKGVEWNSNEDMTTEEFFAWRHSATEGFFAANCVGNVYWFPVDFPIVQIRNFVNRRDRNRFIGPNQR